MKVRTVNFENTDKNQVNLCLFVVKYWTDFGGKKKKDKLSVQWLQCLVWFHPIRPAEQLDLDFIGIRLMREKEKRRKERTKKQVCVCVCVAVCVRLKQQGRQGWESADKELLFVLCCLKELSPCSTHTQSRGFPQCWACELYTVILQSSVNRHIGSLPIRPHIWQYRHWKRDDLMNEDVCRQLATPAPCLCSRQYNEMKLGMLLALSLLRYHIHSADPRDSQCNLNAAIVSIV